MSFIPLLITVVVCGTIGLGCFAVLMPMVRSSINTTVSATVNSTAYWGLNSSMLFTPVVLILLPTAGILVGIWYLIRKRGK